MLDIALVCVALALACRFGDDEGAFGSLESLVLILSLLILLEAWVRRRSIVRFLRGIAATPPEPLQQRIATRLVWTLVVVGFFLRIARVNEYGLNPDEGIFLYVALSPTWSDIWRYGTAEFPHPLSYLFLLHMMTGVSRNLLWLRLPSVLSGTALIWLSHRFGRELFSCTAGLAMAILVTFSPALIDLSRVCRNYALGFPFLIAALYFFVRFLRTARWRDFGLFALMELLATMWVFTFTLVFLATNATLAIALLRRRAPLDSWVRAALFQLPFAGLLTFFYVAQLSTLPAQIVTYHHWIYTKELSPSLLAPAEPLRGVWQYLMTRESGEAFLWLSLFALAWLVAKGDGLKAFLCASPIAAAYLAAWAGQLPVGNTRHGSLLFPFLFALVASLAAHVLRAGSERSTIAATATNSAGVATVTMGLVAYVAVSLLDYGRPAVFEPHRAGRGRELLRHYRQEDVERSFELLERNARPEDLVMMSVEGLFTLRAHLASCRASTEESGTDVHWKFPPRGPVRYRHRGVTFYKAQSGGLRFTPESFGQAVHDTRKTYRLTDSTRVWAIRSGTESPLAEGFGQAYPEAAVDEEVIRASRGWLFAVDGLKTQ